MHALYGYSVKSTWIKAIKVVNYIGWPMLNERNVARYYPDTNKTPKGHLNQSRKMSGPPNLNALPLRCPTQQHYGDARYMTYTPAYTK